MKEKRKFIVHGREYWWTYDEMKEELGVLDDEEAKEIWESAKLKKHKKRIHRRKK
jgi:hypothetical protein